MAGQGSAYSQDLLVTARTLAVDGVTAEVVRALRSRDIAAILLKGPTLTSWLYRDGSARYYLDSDLWVRPDRYEAAEKVLEELGFERIALPPRPAKRPRPHAEPWLRVADRAEVDLHRALSGVAIAPEEAWEQLVRLAEPMEVGGETVDVMPIHVRALLVALHAAQHGPDSPKPLEDLSRALSKSSGETWVEAARMAVELEATPGLALGLRLVPEGQRLAERLELVSPELVEDATREGSTARVLIGLERLASTPGLRRRSRLLRREFFPSRAFLRWWSPLARRGRGGLVLAYVWRPVWLLWHGVPSLIKWRRARQMRSHGERGPL